MNSSYFFDTHAFFFWVTKTNVEDSFVSFFDEVNDNGALYVSSICFWEIALLVKSKRLEIPQLQKWVNASIQSSGIKILDPTIEDMVSSTLLPPHHKDPFDRLLIAQSVNSEMALVTKDAFISKYSVKTFWPK